MISHNPTSDFADVVDGLVAVTFRRKDAPDTSIAITGALRRREKSADKSPGVPTHDARWHLPVGQLAGRPEPGDVIVDAHGATWTVLACEGPTATGRYVCLARDVRRAYGLDQTLTIERAAYTVSDAGVSTARYSPVGRTQGRVREISMAPEGSVVRLAERTFEIVLADDFDLSPHHRIRDERGKVYRVRLAQRKDDPAALMTVTAIAWDESL